MSFHVLIFLFFTFLGFLLSIFFLLKKSGDKFSNLLIAFYTFFFSLEMLHGCLKWSGLLITPGFTHFTEINALLWLSYGPFVYMYVRKAVTNKGLQKSDIVLFLPSLVILVLYAPFYFKTTSEKIAIVSNYQIYNYAIFPQFAIWIVIAIMTLYGIFTFLKFKDNNKVGYRESLWLKWFVGSYVGFVFFFALYVFLVRFNIMSYKYDYFIDAIITIFIISLAYFGFVQPEVFNGKKQLKDIIPFVKYKKTGLSEKVSLAFKTKLDDLMKEENPYLNSELRLDDIASLLKVSRNHASQIINENYNLSFFDYINKYRVGEATKLLLNNEEGQLNITQIAYSSGFNNRASFYKAFKKFTDQSPTTYIKHSTAS